MIVIKKTEETGKKWGLYLDEALIGVSHLHCDAVIAAYKLRDLFSNHHDIVYEMGDKKPVS